MKDQRILVVDDEATMLENCERLLSRAGYACTTLRDPSRFREVAAELLPDVVILDLRMPEIDGMTLLTIALADDPEVPVIIMTAYSTVESAVQAIREGAFDYLTKPFKCDQLVIAVDRAVRHRQLTLEIRALRARVDDAAGPKAVMGSCRSMVRLLDRVERVAASDAGVFITGETGTGKELIARSLHRQSARSDGPFVPVDCAALPEGLLESELFGHEKGAFTGADTEQTGLLDEASGGTAFLDEITELSTPLQAKLLRALEERQVRRVGGSRLIDIDVRIIAATNQDVEQAVAENRFREDLFYRLNVVPIHVPPLRERGHDVVLLAQAFLASFSADLKREPPEVTPDVWQTLEQHDWPGNVRELRNLVERLVVLDRDGVIRLADLPALLRPSVPTTPEGPVEYEPARVKALRAFRASYLEGLLTESGGNVTRAARMAGVNRRTLYRWLAEVDEPE